MTKLEFLAQLEKLLCGLPQDDIQKSLEFYSEMIDDRIEDGFSEEEAISQIGNIGDIAKQILMDIPLPKLVKKKITPRRRMGALEIVLLILGSPIWLSLFISMIAVVLSLYISLWSVIISLYSVAASLIACTIGGAVSGVTFIFSGKYAAGVFMIGAGILCLGLGILMFIGCNYAARGVVWLSRKILFFIKSCFIKGEVK